MNDGCIARRVTAGLPERQVAEWLERDLGAIDRVVLMIDFDARQE